MIQTLFGSLDEKKDKKSGLFQRMKEAVSRTRENLSERIDEIVAFNKEIDANTLDDLEATLIAADLGSATTHEILGSLRERANHRQIGDVNELKRLLQEQIAGILNGASNVPPRRVDGPEVILIVGFNGTGTTTTIGKLASVLRGQGKSVLLC